MTRMTGLRVLDKSAMKMNEGFDKLPAGVQAKIKKNKK